MQKKTDSTNDSPKKTLKNIHVGVEGSVEYFILSMYYRTSVFSVRQNKQTNKQAQQKQNISAALKAMGNDFRRC